MNTNTIQLNNEVNSKVSEILEKFPRINHIDLDLKGGRSAVFFRIENTEQLEVFNKMITGDLYDPIDESFTDESTPIKTAVFYADYVEDGMGSLEVEALAGFQSFDKESCTKLYKQLKKKKYFYL